MIEKKIDLINLDLTLYKYEMENGLQIYMLPYENKNNYYIHYCTKFGSIDTEFIPYDDENMIKVPDGIAHFLEHKMFEVENGITPFEFAANSGTNCNASTGYKVTKYLFEGNQKFEDNLDYLLNYVNQPYFTDENVEKEKGIIIEEILQYKDMIDVEIENIVLNAIFHDDHMKIDIGGSVDSVSSITKEDLYKTYYTFYQPSNMFLVISGNFNKEKALDIIRNNKYLVNKKKGKKIEVKKINEPLEVKEKLVEKKMDIQSSRLIHSIKIPIHNYQGVDRFKYVTNVGIFLNLIFGQASDFVEEANDNKLYTSFYYDRIYTDDYMIISFFTQTDDHENLLNLIKKHLLNYNITEDDVNRIKKCWISNAVMVSDDAGSSLDYIIYNIIEYKEVIANAVDIYRNINLDEMLNIIKNIDFNNSSTVIIKKINSID